MFLLLRVPSTGDRVGAIDPPISQGLVAASLRRRGIDSEVLDLTLAADHGIDQLIEMLADERITGVGMAAYQTNIERCLQIARLVRSKRPDLRIVLGGPQVTHMPPGGLAAMPEIDALCRGPAESVLPKYLAATKPTPTPGFLIRLGDQIVDGGRGRAPSTDEIGSPFHQRVWPLDRYPFVVMFSSRGCPYGCAFCYTPAASGRMMNYAPHASLVRDVTLVAQAGVEHIFFADPIFIVDRTRSVQLLSLLAEIDCGVSFSCELRPERVTIELLRAMTAAGFVKVAYGLETANPSVLAHVRKPMDLDHFRAIVNATIAHGIAVELFCMYGLPGESFDDVRRTFDFVESFHNTVQELSEPQQVQLYFGTELYERRADFGIEVLGSRPAYLSPGRDYRTETLGPDEFAALEAEWATRRASAVRMEV